MSKKIMIPVGVNGVDLKLPVNENGLTVLTLYLLNGQTFQGMHLSSDGIEEQFRDSLIKFPYFKDHFQELVNQGVIFSNKFMFIGGEGVEFIGIRDEVEFANLVPSGTKIYVKTSDGITCGFGRFTQPGLLKYVPVYGDDSYDPGITGAKPGDDLKLFIGIDGPEGDQEVIPYDKSGSLILLKWINADHIQISKLRKKID